MLIAGIGGLVAISLAYIVSGPLLIIAAVLAFFGRAKKAPQAVQPGSLATGAGQSAIPGGPAQP